MLILLRKVLWHVWMKNHIAVIIAGNCIVRNCSVEGGENICLFVCLRPRVFCYNHGKYMYIYIIPFSLTIFPCS